MAKYIQGKQVNGKKVNKLKDFDGMGDAIWNFISSVYESKWDTLSTDQNMNNLRSKISSKFTPCTPPPKGNSKKDTPKSTPVTINKAPPLPPFPAKTTKEINAISKYFHPKKPSANNNNKPNNNQIVKIVEGGLCSFLFFSLLVFFFFFYSLLLFLEQLRLGVISHAVTSVTT